MDEKIKVGLHCRNSCTVIMQKCKTAADDYDNYRPNNNNIIESQVHTDDNQQTKRTVYGGESKKGIFWTD